VVEVAPSEDEDTCFGPVFKRRRRSTPKPSEHSVSDGRGTSPQVPPPSPSPPHDILVQESGGENVPKGGLWDLSLYALSFLEKTLFPTKAKEKLKSLEDDQLMGQMARQLGQALVANCLIFDKVKRWKDSAKEEALRAAKLAQRVSGLTLTVEELQRTHQETKALLTEKSKEALELSAKNVDLHAEVEKLKEELAKKGEELLQKDELMEKTKEALTNDDANSYLAGFDDVVAQASCFYPESDFSQFGLHKIVVDGRLVDEE